MSLQISPRLAEFCFPDLPIDDIATFYHVNNIKVPEGRPYMWSNSVISLDGCLSYSEENDPDAGGISLRYYYPDVSKVDFKMLHAGWAFADAVIASGAELRNEAHVKFNLLFDDLVNYRVNILKKPKHPILFILTGSGSIPITHNLFHEKLNPVYIITTTAGKQSLKSAIAAHMQSPQVTSFNPPEIISFDHSDDPKRVDYHAFFSYLRKEMNLRFVDCTCGGNVIKQLIWEKMLDEIRMTYAGQLAGLLNSQGTIRPSLFPINQKAIDVGEKDTFTKETAPHFLYKGIRLCGERLLFVRSTIEYRH